MQERFSDRARHAMALANREADRLNHDFIGPEHILLGLIAEGECLAARILIAQGVSLDALREEVLAMLHSATDPKHDTSSLSHGEFEWIHQQELAKAFRSPEFWHTLILAVDSANRLGHGELHGEHLLLAILRDHHGRVGRMLAEKGVTADWVRSQLTGAK